MSKHTSHTTGFTLIELLLYVGVIGVLMIGVVMFLGRSLDARVKGQAIVEVNQQGTQIMELITQTIRNADSITAPAAAASGSSLTLVVPTGSLSPTVFDLSGTTLQIKEGAGAAVALSNSKVAASGLTFTNLTRSGTSGVIQVSFTLSRVNPANRTQYDYQKTFITSAALRP